MHTVGIPESQLEAWSNQGAIVGSANTHHFIRAALDAHRWPPGMAYSAYLQGSYANATNIRGNSDVDLVVETSAVFYSNLTEEEKRARGLTVGAFSWRDFRSEVFSALANYYGTANIEPGDKSIKVAAWSNRLAADVIPCAEYREYQDGQLYGVGITFWAQSDFRQIINFPKLHIENGAVKNSASRTRGWYKPTVRMFKNARERMIESDPDLRKRYPSYFVECLLYNASDRCYGTSYRDTFVAVVNELSAALAGGGSTQYVCQNERRWLFGPSSVQWNRADAQSFVAALIHLWNNW
jgi:hypothetical protein